MKLSREEARRIRAIRCASLRSQEVIDTLTGTEVAQSGDPQPVCKDRVRRIIANLIGSIPAYEPPQRKPRGRVDGDWLLCLAEQWEVRARSRLATKIEPREMWSLSQALRKAGNALDAFEYSDAASRAPTHEDLSEGREPK